MVKSGIGGVWFDGVGFFRASRDVVVMDKTVERFSYSIDIDRTQRYDRGTCNAHGVAI